LQSAEVIDFAKSLKSSKASKAGTWYKIGTKPFSTSVPRERTTESNLWAATILALLHRSGGGRPSGLDKQGGYSSQPFDL